MPFLILPVPNKSAATHIRVADGTFAMIIDCTGKTVEGDTSKLHASIDGFEPLPPTPVPPRELSKLTIKRRLEGMGKWEAFKAFIAALPSLDDEFWLAQSIRTDDPMFTTYASQVKQALGLSDAQFSELLR